MYQDFMKWKVFVFFMQFDWFILLLNVVAEFMILIGIGSDHQI